MVVPKIPVSWTAKEKLEIVRQHIQQNGINEDGRIPTATANDERKLPSYNDVLQDLLKSDYDELLTCPLDLHPGLKRKTEPKIEFSSADAETAPRRKTICAQGVVCSAKLELFPFPEGLKGRPYSGLLKPSNVVEHCLVRLSSALQPMDIGNNGMAKLMFGEKVISAKIFPGAAIKMFRSNQNSGNILFLGSKVGQPEDEFFAHCLCTQVTTRMPVTSKPILQIFRRYSDLPTALGLSDVCTYDANGEMADDLNFPYCLTLHPRVRTKVNLGRDMRQEDTNASVAWDSFLDDIQQIPKGTTLFDVFASPDPLSVTDATKLQRIGRLVSTSAMHMSPHDDGLFFRHQKKDEDFALRPEWKDDLDAKVVLKDGTEGTASSLAGWELFEQQIQQGRYIDFEKPNK